MSALSYHWPVIIYLSICLFIYFMCYYREEPFSEAYYTQEYRRAPIFEWAILLKIWGCLVARQTHSADQYWYTFLQKDLETFLVKGNMT